MVIKPSECVTGNVAFEAAIKKYCAYFDDTLQREWYRGCGKLRIDMPDFKVEYNMLQKVKTEIAKQYTLAGWSLLFDSPDRSGESGEWVMFSTLSS